MKHPNRFALFDYKIAVGKNLIQYHEDRAGQCQCQDHLRRRTNLNRLIIKEYIYQIIKRCKNDARTVQWRVKKTEHSSSVCLVTFHYA